MRKISFLSVLLTGIFALNLLQAQEPIDLRPYEQSWISQYGEDGVLEKIFKLIGSPSKYYVEFGCGNGHYCSNTEYLREKFGWTGLLMDAAYPSDPSINQHNEFITAENICELFRKYNVPEEPDLVSIDIDRNDFYVWKAMAKHYKPRVVLIECNPSFGPKDDRVVRYKASERSMGMGGGILAFYKLGKKLGYSLVYAESQGVNLFFVRNDVLQASGVTFKDMNDVKKLYRGKPVRFSRNKKSLISAEKVLD